MNTRCWCAVACILALAACGGGGGSDTPSDGLSDSSVLTAGRTTYRTWSPNLWIDNYTHIGAGVTEAVNDKDLPLDGMRFVERHGNASVYFGSVRDGVGRTKLVEYLTEDAEDREFNPNRHLMRFGSEPPVVIVAPGASDEHVRDVWIAVQMINASLPDDWQLGLTYDRASTPQTGEIVVTFARRETWPNRPGDNRTGESRRWSDGMGKITKSHIWVDHTRQDGSHDTRATIVHELLHSLGRGHPDPYRFRDTVMLSPSWENSGHILYPLDREGLLAVYSRLEPGARPENIHRDLGPWEQGSTHVAGASAFRGGRVWFGAAESNDLVQPWVIGPTPPVWLEENPRLSGSATWNGRLLGFTPTTEVVAGDSRLRVHLASLAGTLNFTGLESWAANEPPAAIGSGRPWGNGDLSYGIKVLGNTFYAPNVSEGIVNGSFFGVAHEGMGGILRREDLKAAFGGTRQ